MIVSGVIALTLSPMMCSRLLRHEDSSSGFANWLERAFSALKRRYGRVLGYAMANRPIVLVFAVAVFVSLFFLFCAIPQELAPLEDTGHVYIVGEAPFNSTLEYTTAYTTEVERVMRETPEYKGLPVAGMMGDQHLLRHDRAVAVGGTQSQRTTSAAGSHGTPGIHCRSAHQRLQHAVDSGCVSRTADPLRHCHDRFLRTAARPAKSRTRRVSAASSSTCSRTCVSKSRNCFSRSTATRPHALASMLPKSEPHWPH